MKKINFKQPKYIIPTIAYFGLLLLGYLFINLFNTKIDKEDNTLQTTEYLNSDLPTANVSKDIGSKRKNVNRMFGNIVDRSAVSNIDQDRDSLNKKEEFESRYSEEELKLLEQQQQQKEEIKRLKELNEQLKNSKEGSGRPAVGGTGGSTGHSTLPGSDAFVPSISDAERTRILEDRRRTMMRELDRDLNNIRGSGQSKTEALAAAQDSIYTAKAAIKEVVVHENAVHALDEKADNKVVVKKSVSDSKFFNTLSSNESNNNLIKAIIDEEVKAVDGSRVRLRLLDDIEIDGTTIRKGTYMYATMKGFSQQRIRGSVESVLVGDEILKINLSIYDVTDGLEGLYVPESQFRETAKDVGSTALQSNMNMDIGNGGSSITQWAGQAIQNAYQKTSNAISKAIKKNRVRIKYGTHVYLINGQNQKRK